MEAFSFSDDLFQRAETGALFILRESGLSVTAGKFSCPSTASLMQNLRKRVSRNSADSFVDGLEPLLSDSSALYNALLPFTLPNNQSRGVSSPSSASIFGLFELNLSLL
jgi:hypothetical protein